MGICLFSFAACTCKVGTFHDNRHCLHLRDGLYLQNVTCTFNEGAFSAVIGTSGSGKTTLLSIMAGLDKPTAGKVYIDGEDVFSLDLDLYRREYVSMIFQAFQLFPMLTALENVSYPLQLNGANKEQAVARARTLLEAVDISAEKHGRYPSNLSGGEQQRVAIARALASGARVLLADEPTGNLDSTNGENVINILRRLAHHEGYCVIVVTHNSSIAESSDAVFTMKDGVLA